MPDTILYSATNAGAILTSTKQGPSGTSITVTGTGIVLAAAGAIVGTALGGTAAGQVPVWSGTQWTAIAFNPTLISQSGATAGQVMAWNGTQWGAQTLAGDAAGPYSALVVSAVHGQAVAAGTAAGQVWTYNGTSWAPGAVAAGSIAPGTNTYVLTTMGGVAVWAAPAGGITALTGDVTASGSGSVAATAVSAQNGLLTFAATTGLITASATATGPGLAQASTAASVTGAVLTITPQPSSLSGANGSILAVNLSVPGTGNEGGLDVFRGSTRVVRFGPTSAAQSGCWLGSGAAAPSTSNYVFAADLSGNTVVNTTSGVINFYTNSAFLDATLAFAGMGLNGSLTVGSTSSILAGGAGGIIGLAKAGTNPSSSISTGGVIYADSSTGALCLYPAGVTAPALTAANGTVYVAAVLQTGTNLAVGGAGTGPGGGGVGVIALNNAATQPTAASVAGGVALAASSGGLAIYAPSGTVAAMILGNNPTASGGQGVIVLNAAHANPSVSLTSQGVIYTDSSTGGICLYPASVTAPMLNVNTTYAGFGTPLAGLNATPLQFNFTSVAIGVGGTTPVSAAAALTPKLILSGGTLTSAAIVDFTTNAGTFAGAVYFCDCAAVNGGAALTTFGLSFRNGTTTLSLAALPIGGLVIVTISGANKITIN